MKGKGEGKGKGKGKGGYKVCINHNLKACICIFLNLVMSLKIPLLPMCQYASNKWVRALDILSTCIKKVKWKIVLYSHPNSLPDEKNQIISSTANNTYDILAGNAT